MVEKINPEKFGEILDQFDPKDQKIIAQIHAVIDQYPYFQLPRFLYTQSLKIQDSINYKTGLNQLALYTYDRSVLKNNIDKLFDAPKRTNSSPKPKDKFKYKKAITAKKTPPKYPTLTKKNTPLESVPINTTKPSKSKKERSNPSQANQNTTETLKLSFLDWIDYTMENPNVTGHSKKQNKQPLEDKLNIIDQFISADPRISPVSSYDYPPEEIKNEYDREELMTETLAKVLVKQKKYKKAISAYKILSLKYPEKNVFFAGQIQKIKDLRK